jgi:3D (Asp-Asp-Asp) domain-containing protein
MARALLLIALHMRRNIAVSAISRVSAVLLGLASSAASANEPPWLDVDVTAYNATVAQTDESPSIAAWGDRLRPGMRAIAVSRDLLSLGLDRGTRVQIDGLPGEYVVLDKTHRRWTRRVDLFMGKDVRKALSWGKRKMRIRCIEPCARFPEPPQTVAAAAEIPSPRGSLRDWIHRVRMALLGGITGA